MLTPAQYKTEAPGLLTNIERKFTNATVRLFYSGYTTSFGGQLGCAGVATDDRSRRSRRRRSTRSGSASAPSASRPPGCSRSGSPTPAPPPDVWTSLDLVQDPVDSTLWTGTLTVDEPGDVEFIVQAVNGVGLVSLDDNQGELYRPGQIAAALQSGTAALDPTSLTLTAPASATYSDEITLSATLTTNGAPLSGAPIRFTVGGSEVTAFTGSTGSASVEMPVLALPPDTVVSAAFDGSPTFEPSADSQPFSVGKLGTTLALTSTPTGGSDTGVVATLTADGVPIHDHSVLFRLTGPSLTTPIVASRVTGLGGRALLGSVTLSDGSPLPPGSYTVTAYFGPNAALGFTVPDDPIYLATSTGSVPVGTSRKIVFASARTGNGDIYAVDPAGGNPVQLTTGTAIDAEPEWSPRGDKIVFTSTRTTATSSCT